MFSNKLALALFGFLALAGAAGAGAFIATRQAPAQPGPAIGSVSAADFGQDPAGQPVDATEAVMDDDVPAEAPAVEPVGPKAPAKAAKAAAAAPARRRAAPARVERTVPAPRRPAPAAPAARGPAARVPAEPSEPADSDRQARRTTSQAEPAGSWPRAETAGDSGRRAVDPVDPLPPPAPRFEEMTVPADAVIGLRLESGVSSETARVEDRVEARVTRDVRSGGRVVVPAGSRMLGSVSVVERGGKMKERARLGVRFHTLVLADGTEVALQTETVYREGESPANASASKVGGGAIGGAILGAILGGGKGAAIGAGVGAGAGTAAVMAGGRRPAQIQAGAPLTVKVLSPVTVTVEQ